MQRRFYVRSLIAALPLTVPGSGTVRRWVWLAWLWRSRLRDGLHEKDRGGPDALCYLAAATSLAWSARNCASVNPPVRA